MSNKTIRVLMFPWLGYGHITPYFELAKKLTARNFIVYICSTSTVLGFIEEKIPENLSDSIILETLELPSSFSEELPLEFHTTNGLPLELMPVLKQAFDASAPTFADILSKLKPDLLIYDFLQPWAPQAAEEQGIPAVEFITSSSTMTSYMFHYFKKKDLPFPSEKIKFRPYEASMKEKLLECANNPEEADKASEGVARSCGIVLIKGFREIEDTYIDYVSELVNKRFVPVGPLLQEPSPYDLDDHSFALLSWLDEQEPKSTVLVTFGSEYYLKKRDIDEIAYGLELSQIPFIWVVRFPKRKNCKDDETLLKKTLPSGFLERIGNRGIVVPVWAPQTKILGHENIGGFVSHCGWNSIIESVAFGVPIIAVPMHLDQPINARLVEEVGVGVEVLRDEKGKLLRDRLAAVIKQVVVEESGELVRQTANAMKKKIGAKGDEEIDQVVRELVDICKKD